MTVSAASKQRRPGPVHARRPQGSRGRGVTVVVAHKVLHVDALEELRALRRDVRRQVLASERVGVVLVVVLLLALRHIEIVVELLLALL